MTADRAIKEPCRVATTANISLSGLQTIDGVTVAAGDRVLVKNQSSAVNNGIYDAATGSWTRSSDFDGAGEVVGGTETLVTSGSTQAGNLYRVTGAGAITIGSSAINFELVLEADRVFFQQAGTGAVTRSVEARLRDEWVSVKDFGATGDGSTDDTAEINAAVAALNPGQTLYFPDGSYVVSVSDGVEKAISPIPVGCNVFMEGGALLTTVATGAMTFLTPLGNNILQVNIDGNGYPTSGGVRGVWRNSVVGIRCHDSAPYGLDTSYVTVVNSNIRNARACIRADGARNWRIADSRFTGTELSGIMFGFWLDHDCLYNIVTGCTFEDHGDTAIAFFQTPLKTAGGYCLHNSVANCIAKNTNLGSASHGEGAGWAFDVEAGDPVYQQHISFVNLIVEQEAVSGATLQRGAATMGGVRNALMLGINAKSYSNAAEDIAINMTNCIGGLIDDYVVENFGGSAINTDGCDGAVVGGNGTIINCGGRAGNTPAIRGSLEFPTRNVTINAPKIVIKPGYPYRASEAAIAFLANNAAAVPVNCEIVGGSAENPMDWGVAIFGHKHPETQVVTPARNCRVKGFRATGTSDGDDYFKAIAVLMRYVTNAEILDIRIDPQGGALAKGIDARDCTNVLVDRIHVLGGTVTNLFDFTGSTEVRVDNQRTAPGATVTNHIASGGNGTATRWGEHIDAYPLPNAANDTAAAALTPPVPVGAPYRNGSVRMVRVS